MARASHCLRALLQRLLTMGSRECNRAAAVHIKLYQHLVHIERFHINVIKLYAHIKLYVPIERFIRYQAVHT